MTNMILYAMNQENWWCFISLQFFPSLVLLSSSRCEWVIEQEGIMQKTLLVGQHIRKRVNKVWINNDQVISFGIWSWCGRIFPPKGSSWLISHLLHVCSICDVESFLDGTKKVFYGKDLSLIAGLQKSILIFYHESGTENKYIS